MMSLLEMGTVGCVVLLQIKIGEGGGGERVSFI